MLKNCRPVIALIPARGGSKGIPRKNLKLICGRPLIDYTISAAKESSLIDEIWVSSDDSEIIDFSLTRNIHTLLRPSELSNDMTSAVEVVRHFIEKIPKTVCELDPFIVYLQPTSPLRNSKHIDEAIIQMMAAGLTATLSVSEAEKSPYKAFQLDDSGNLISLFDERLSNARRQDLPRCFYPNGAIYGFHVSEFLKRNGFPSNGSYPYVMANIESIDIDTTEDLIHAEMVLGKINGSI
jgi:CMP-N,N'-diacetyllegionaminic acid synthase